MLEIVQVSVGQPEHIGNQGPADRPVAVWSSIRKRPVTGSELYLTRTGLTGDQQADTGFSGGKQVHGGHIKAVYCYPAEHFGDWTRGFARAFGPAAFGENLTVRGLVESEVNVGDRFAWGDAILEVTQPREPCFKLGMVLGKEIALDMRHNGRCGWYCEVAKPGVVPVVPGVKLERIERGGGDSIAVVFEEKMQRKGRNNLPGLRADL